MGLSYNKLWKLLIDKGINRSQLSELTGISRATMAKLNSKKNVNTKTLEQICKILSCDIGDIVEYENKE